VGRAFECGRKKDLGPRVKKKKKASACAGESPFRSTRERNHLVVRKEGEKKESAPSDEGGAQRASASEGTKRESLRVKSNAHGEGRKRGCVHNDQQQRQGGGKKSSTNLR